MCLIPQYFVQFVRARKGTKKDDKDGQRYRTISVQSICTNNTLKKMLTPQAGRNG